MSDQLPKGSAGDTLHQLAQAGVSAIPFAGGPLAVLFNMLVKVPVQRRWEAFFADLAQRIAKLEQDDRLSVGDLRNNDGFISTMMQAAQVVVRNHQQDKIGARLNAVLNTALGQAPDDSKRQMFLGFVDAFTVWHLRALVFLGDPDRWVRRDGLRMQSNLVCNSVDAALRSQFAELYREPDLRRVLIQDLRSRSLIQKDDAEFEFSAADTGRRTHATTPLGREFLQFIVEPREAPQ